MSKLKIGTILDDKPVKLAIELPAHVNRDLIPRGGAGTRNGPDYRARQAHRPDVGPLHVNRPRIRAVSSSEERDQSIGSRIASDLSCSHEIELLVHRASCRRR